MQSIAVFVALLAMASAANVQFAVQHPGSVVTSQRLGGNFAYSVNQGGYPYTAGYPYTTGYTGSPVVYTAGTTVPVQTVGTQYAYSTPTQYVQKTVGNVNAVPVTYGSYPYTTGYTGYTGSPVVYTAGTVPASTYKTVGGVSPVAYSGLVGGYGAYPTGYNGYPYGQVVY